MEDYNDLIEAIKGFHDWKGIDFPQWFQKHMSRYVKSPLFPERSQLFRLGTHGPLWSLQLTTGGKHKVCFPQFLNRHTWVVKLRKKALFCFLIHDLILLHFISFWCRDSTTGPTQSCLWMSIPSKDWESKYEERAHRRGLCYHPDRQGGRPRGSARRCSPQGHRGAAVGLRGPDRKTGLRGIFQSWCWPRADKKHISLSNIAGSISKGSYLCPNSFIED